MFGVVSGNSTPYIFSDLTSYHSGTVETLWPFVFGRFVAGIGGAGMTDLLSVLVNGKILVASFGSSR